MSFVDFLYLLKQALDTDEDAGRALRKVVNECDQLMHQAAQHQGPTPDDIPF